jgi:hypothetical protein
LNERELEDRGQSIVSYVLFLIPSYHNNDSNILVEQKATNAPLQKKKKNAIANHRVSHIA